MKQGDREERGSEGPGPGLPHQAVRDGAHQSGWWNVDRSVGMEGTSYWSKYNWTEVLFVMCAAVTDQPPTDRFTLSTSASFTHFWARVIVSRRAPPRRPPNLSHAKKVGRRQSMWLEAGGTLFFQRVSKLSSSGDDERWSIYKWIFVITCFI